MNECRPIGISFVSVTQDMQGIRCASSPRLLLLRWFPNMEDRRAQGLDEREDKEPYLLRWSRQRVAFHNGLSSDNSQDKDS